MLRAQREIEFTSQTWEYCSPPTKTRNALKPTGTGSSRGPRTRGLGAQMFNSDRCVRVEHFFGVPAESIFGGVKVRPRLFRSYTRTHATPARRVRRAQASLTGVRPLTLEYCSPSSPSGLLPHSGRVQSSIMEVLLPPSCGFHHARKRPLKVYAVLKLVLRMKSPDMGVLLPLLPFGLSSPTREECSPPKMRDMLFVLFDKVLVSHRDNRAANSTH